MLTVFTYFVYLESEYAKIVLIFNFIAFNFIFLNKGFLNKHEIKK